LLGSSVLLHWAWVFEDLLEKEQEFFGVGELLWPLEWGSGDVSSVLLEVAFVLGLLVVQVSHFTDFVVVDEELSSSKVDVVECGLCSGGNIWGLEADKSVDVLVWLGWVTEHSQILDFSLFGENLSEHLFIGVWREVSHVQVASLFGVLVLDGLSLAFSCALRFLECLFDVKFVSVNGVFVHLFNGGDCAFDAVFFISFRLRVEADKGKQTFWGLVFDEFD